MLVTTVECRLYSCLYFHGFSNENNNLSKFFSKKKSLGTLA